VQVRDGHGVGDVGAASGDGRCVRRTLRRRRNGWFGCFAEWAKRNVLLFPFFWKGKKSLFRKKVIVVGPGL
jgi:hypothetical protein